MLNKEPRVLDDPNAYRAWIGLDGVDPGLPPAPLCADYNPDEFVSFITDFVGAPLSPEEEAVFGDMLDAFFA